MKKLDSIKKLWKNPRGHALIELGFYLLFFLVIFLMLSFHSSGGQIQTVEDRFSSKINYTYQITIEDQKTGVLDRIEGSRANNIESFERLDLQYQILEDKIIQNGEEVILYPFDWNHLKPSYLSKVFETGTLISTTNYVDEKQKREYQMECNQYDSGFVGICSFYFLESNSEITQVSIINDQYKIEINFDGLQVSNE